MRDMGKFKTKMVCESQRVDHPQWQKIKIKKWRPEPTQKNGKIIKQKWRLRKTK